MYWSMRRKRMRTEMVVCGFLLALSLLAAGCADEAGVESGESVDELQSNLVCPEGQIPYRPSPTPLSRYSQDYESRAGGDAALTVEPPPSINVQRISCGTSVEEKGDAVGFARSQCDGKQECRFVASCVDDYFVEYGCGDRDAEGNANLQKATPENGFVNIDCRPTEASSESQEVKTVCIPQQCHGRARRDINMQCVADPTKLEVRVSGVFSNVGGVPIPKYHTQTDRNRARLSNHPQIGDDFSSAEILYPDVPYEISFKGVFAFGEDFVPDLTTWVVWMDDTFVHRDGEKTVQGFRCVPFSADVRKTDASTDRERGGWSGYNWLPPGREFSVNRTSAFSADCVDSRLAIQDAARNAGLSVKEFQAEYTYQHSNLHLSYDLEGRTVHHTGISYDSPEVMAENTPQCAPNPPELFYDAATQTYDMRSYYAQRRVYSMGKRFKFAPKGLPRRAQIGPIDIEARSDWNIRVSSLTNPPLPVDLRWYAANLDKNNPHHPWPEGNVEVGKGWRTNNPNDNFGVPNLRAKIYVFPRGALPEDRDLEHGLLASIPLNDGRPEGKTETINIPATARVKDLFTRSSSDHYISGDSRQFWLYYCIESDRGIFQPWGWPDSTVRAPSYAADLGSKWDQDANLKSKMNSSLYLDYSVATLQNLQLTAPFDYYYPPEWNRPPLRGCRVSPRALNVHIDRFETPVEPIASTGYSGAQSTSATGDASMSGQNDNDNQVTCEGMGTDCEETQRGASRTGGSGARSFFQVNTTATRTPGTDVSAGMTGEMLGYMLIDPEDEESSSSPWPNAPTSNPVTLSFSPDWDSLRDALNRASSGVGVAEWNTGRYAGIQGLGLAWGVKFRWQVGPVPVLVTIAATVGVSLEFTASFQFAPGDDDAYPCLSATSPCVTVHTSAATFADANEACNVSGGRLMELSSATEAASFMSSVGSSEPWVGAQLAYRHPRAQCSGSTYQSSQCDATSRTEYRWISSGTAFANQEGFGTTEFDDSKVFDIPNATNLRTRYPTKAAVYYRRDGTLGTSAATTRRPYLCYHDAAERESFLKWSLGLGLGAAAGFGITGCVPSDNPGFCLGANMNLVSMSISPTYSNVYHWLYRSGESEPFGRRGNTNISIPWALNLFEGSVTASISVLWFTLQWALLSYDGIEIASGKLLDINVPTIENWQ